MKNSEAHLEFEHQNQWRRWLEKYHAVETEGGE
jgi:hypothetical protein